MPSHTFDPTATSPSGLAIANHVGRLISAYTGRGPTKPRTSFGADLVTVVVRDLLTKGEHSLVRDGRADAVLDLRRAYQATMGDELTDGIEEITGRRANHIDPDIAIESVVLAPRQTGTIARMLSLRLDDAEAGGSWARRPTPSGAVVYSSARDAVVPKAKAAALRSVLAEPAVPSRTDRSSAPRRRSAVAALFRVA